MSLPADHAPLPEVSASLAPSPLLAALEGQLSSLRLQLADLALAYEVYSSGMRPTLEEITAQAHAAALAAQQEAVDSRTHTLQIERTRWESIDAPAARAAITQAEADLAIAQTQYADLQQTQATLQAQVTQLSELEAQHAHRSSRPAAGSLAALPLPLLRSLLRFLTKSDLTHMALTCPAWNRRLDRGILWGALAVRMVAGIISTQRAAQQAADAKRRAMHGLPQEYQSANFLACCAVQQALSTPNGVGNSSNASASPDSPTLPLQVDVRIAFPNPRNKGAPPLPKSDMYSLALRSLQRSVDPALSDFEDQGMKLAAHQRIIAFLQGQQKEMQHKLGVARLSLGAEQASLRAASLQKDALARDIQSLEQRIDAEKAAQAAQAAQEEAQARAHKQAENLRRNLDSLVQQSLPDEGHDHAADANGNATAAGGSDRSARSKSISLMSGTASSEELAAGIALLKQQKKVLVKAVRSMQADLLHTQEEKETYTRKLQELKAKLAAVNL